MRIPRANRWIQAAVMLLLAAGSGAANAQEIVVVGSPSANCNEDPACINRLHPAIPQAVRARPGATLVFHTRNASDFELGPDAAPDPRAGDPQFGTVHPL
ncbi:MAG: hypothetical protein R3314_15080, partial [Longimicrobiales bacterium]|nr:hypothetical protein [Longimicrobiales bacterium]